MFTNLIDKKRLGGLNCLIWQNGKIIFEKSQGFSDYEQSELMSFNTLFRIASMTKPITSVIAMMLYEEGKFDLNTPITKWFPEFKKMKVLLSPFDKFENVVEANREITILDLLTHTAGFTYGDFHSGEFREAYFKTLGGDIDNFLTNEQWIKGLASLPLISQPGEVFNYGKSTDLLGLLISKIEKKSLGEVMSDKLFKPLNMNDTFFLVPKEKKKRCASNFGFDDTGKLTKLDTVPLKMALNDRPIDMEFESGSSGLWSTIEDYLKFAEIFISNGKSNNIQIVKEETIEFICSNKLTPTQREKSTLMGMKTFKDIYGFGLGVAVLMKENQYSSIPCSGSVGSVGWPGAYGGWWSADRQKKTIAIFLTHNMITPNQMSKGIGLHVYEAIETFSNYYKNIIIS